MKKIFLVFSETRSGKHYAHAETIRAGENLKTFIDRYPYSDIIHVCENATQAANIAESWNQAYKNNNTFMY